MLRKFVKYGKSFCSSLPNYLCTCLSSVQRKNHHHHYLSRFVIRLRQEMSHIFYFLAVNMRFLRQPIFRQPDALKQINNVKKMQLNEAT